MSCRAYALLLADRADDLLSPAERHALDAHIALCRRCARHDQELRDLARLLREDGSHEPPPSLDRRVLTRVAKEADGPWARLRREALRWLPLRPRAGLAPSSLLAASAALVVLGVLSEPFEPRSPGASLHAERPIAPRLAGSARAGEVTLPAPPRSSGLLTIWDSSAERIVASTDALGVDGARAPEPAVGPRGAPGEAASLEDSTLRVQIYLYERIDVHG